MQVKADACKDLEQQLTLHTAEAEAQHTAQRTAVQGNDVAACLVFPRVKYGVEGSKGSKTRDIDGRKDT